MRKATKEYLRVMEVVDRIDEVLDDNSPIRSKAKDIEELIV